MPEFPGLPADAPRPPHLVGEELARLLIRDLPEATTNTLLHALVATYGEDVAILGTHEWMTLYRNPA